MGRIDGAKTLMETVNIVFDVWHKLKSSSEDAKAKEKKIKELETEIARLKGNV